MATLTLKLNLPDRMASEATEMGLLEPENLKALLGDAIRTRRLEGLVEARRKVAQAGIAPMEMEEILSEIEGDRSERRAKPIQ